MSVCLVCRIDQEVDARGLIAAHPWKGRPCTGAGLPPVGQLLARLEAYQERFHAPVNTGVTRTNPNGFQAANSFPQRAIEVRGPTRLADFSGRRDPGENFRMKKGTKPPKLRCRPGYLVQKGEQLYECMYCYRLQENPQEWIYLLEERKDLFGHVDGDRWSSTFEVMGAGADTPRIVYDLFRSSTDAFAFFSDIYRKADSVCCSNKQFVQQFKVVSCGVIINEQLTK